MEKERQCVSNKLFCVSTHTIFHSMNAVVYWIGNVYMTSKTRAFSGPQLRRAVEVTVKRLPSPSIVAVSVHHLCLPSVDRLRLPSTVYANPA